MDTPSKWHLSLLPFSPEHVELLVQNLPNKIVYVKHWKYAGYESNLVPQKGPLISSCFKPSKYCIQICSESRATTTGVLCISLSPYIPVAICTLFEPSELGQCIIGFFHLATPHSSNPKKTWEPPKIWGNCIATMMELYKAILNHYNNGKWRNYTIRMRCTGTNTKDWRTNSFRPATYLPERLYRDHSTRAWHAARGWSEACPKNETLWGQKSLVGYSCGVHTRKNQGEQKHSHGRPKPICGSSTILHRKAKSVQAKTNERQNTIHPIGSQATV